MANRIPFAPGEWYHCYCRGVDKRNIFLDHRDYERFILYLHVANGPLSVHISNLTKHKSYNEILSESYQKEPIVDIGAFCLMPNHFHLLLKEIKEGGISLFMQKVLTGQTMYFNTKYERKGALFANTFNSRHIRDDGYFKRVLSYIHLNPVELEEKGWKIGKGDINRVEKILNNYRYSSFSAFNGIDRLTNTVVSQSIFDLSDLITPTKEMIKEAHAYYQQNIKV